MGASILLYRIAIFSIVVLAQTLAFADDCAEIRAALAGLSPKYGGEVFIAAGDYYCSEPIVLDHDNVWLHGPSDDKAEIHLTNGANAPLIVVGDISTPPSPHRNIQVSYLTIDGNRDNQSSECWGGECDTGGTAFIRNNGISVRGVSDTRFDHLVIHHARSGGIVTERGCYNLLLDQLTSTDHYFDGFAGYQTYNSVFENMILKNNHAAGISIDIDFSRNELRNVTIEDNGDVGVFMRDSNANVFSNIKIKRNHNHGVFLSRAEDLKSCANDNEFRNVDIQQSKGFGFVLGDKCTGNKLTGVAKLIENEKGCLEEPSGFKLVVQGELVCR